MYDILFNNLLNLQEITLPEAYKYTMACNPILFVILKIIKKNIESKNSYLPIHVFLNYILCFILLSV